jgi:hypothetical protein
MKGPDHLAYAIIYGGLLLALLFPFLFMAFPQ